MYQDISTFYTFFACTALERDTFFCSAAATSEAFWARLASVVAEAAQGHSVILGLGEGMSRSLRPWEILYQCTLPDQHSLVKESELR